MFRAIAATAAVGLVTALTASAGAVYIGGPTGLSLNYITQGSGAVCAAGTGNCVTGSTGGWAEKNYDNVLFGGATNGTTSPVPYAGYVQNGGEPAGLTATSVGGGTSAAGVTFAMMSDGAAGGGAGASRNLWEASAANTSIVVPIGVYDVTDVATLLQNAWGTVGGNDTDITFNFGSSSNATTGITSLTFDLNNVNNQQNGAPLSGVIRASIGCTTTTTAACNNATNPNFTLPLTSTLTGSDQNNYTVNTSAVFGTKNTYGGAFNYNANGTGLYLNTAGQLKMDDQDFVFGNAFANDWLVSITVSQTGTFGNNVSATTLSAITVDSAVPEPGTIVLLFAGLGGIAAVRRLRKA